MATGPATYRNLLRAIRLAFQGDVPTMTAARNAARDQFIQHRNAAADQIQGALNHAAQVTTILRENVVQGRNVGDNKYKLNIHEHTERGDNATVKKLDNRVKSFKEMKSS